MDELNRAGRVVNDQMGSNSLVVIYHDGVGRVMLPKIWQEALAELDGQDVGVQHANELTLNAVQGVLRKYPSLIGELTQEALLAMPAQVRLSLLSEYTLDEGRDQHGRKELFTPNFRNEVAARGLIGEVRAYERESYSFRAAKSKGKLRDERGKLWQITEEALIGPEGQELGRLSGHLAYWFGWFAFFPQTAIYQAQDPR